MAMHDEVLVALISTIGSIIVAYITTQQHKNPSEDDRLREENKRLKQELKEKEHEDNH